MPLVSSRDCGARRATRGRCEFSPSSYVVDCALRDLAAFDGAAANQRVVCRENSTRYESSLISSSHFYFLILVIYGPYCWNGREWQMAVGDLPHKSSSSG